MPYADVSSQKKAQHESYLRNKDSYKQRRTDRRTMLRKLVDDLKAQTPCLDCGIHYPAYVTDYHHRDPEMKDQSISKLVADLRAVDRILAEIDKCDLLCANCHRIREHKDNERFRL